MTARELNAYLNDKNADEIDIVIYHYLDDGTFNYREYIGEEDIEIYGDEIKINVLG